MQEKKTLNSNKYLFYIQKLKAPDSKKNPGLSFMCSFELPMNMKIINGKEYKKEELKTYEIPTYVTSLAEGCFYYDNLPPQVLEPCLMDTTPYVILFTIAITVMITMGKIPISKNIAPNTNITKRAIKVLFTA